MAKKYILALLIIIIIVLAFFMINNNNTVNVYIDGENVSAETHSLSDTDLKDFNSKVCDLTVNVMNNTTANVSTLRNDIECLCEDYGLKNPKINIDSSIGADQIPVIITVDGISMLPTLVDGQQVLLNKTHDIHVGDIVVAESDEYGGIIKRVDEIKGDSVHLVSDNNSTSYEYIDGVLYEIEGIETWVDISDINGVIIDY